MTVNRAPNLHITNLPRRVDWLSCRSHNNNIPALRTFVACHYPATEKTSTFLEIFTLLLVTLTVLTWCRNNHMNALSSQNIHLLLLYYLLHDMRSLQSVIQISQRGCLSALILVRSQMKQYLSGFRECTGAATSLRQNRCVIKTSHSCQRVV